MFVLVITVLSAWNSFSPMVNTVANAERADSSSEETLSSDAAFSTQENSLPINENEIIKSEQNQPNEVDVSNDYILFSPMGSKETYLMNRDGLAVYTWEAPGNSAYLLENGNLLRTGNIIAEGGKSGGYVEEIAPDQSVVWSFEYDREQGSLHHDIEPMPNGNILMIAGETKTQNEAIEAGRDPRSVGEEGLRPDHIIELDPRTNEIVWEWHVWDHLIQDYDATKENFGVVADHPDLINLNYVRGKSDNPDWNHMNSIAYHAELDQIMISVHSFSEIWIIDHSTTIEEAAGHTGGNSGKGGDLLYRWGNPQTYDAGDSSEQQLFVQHDARWIPEGYPGEGNILVFNNGRGRDGGLYSSVDEIAPPLDESGNYRLIPGEAFGPKVPIWSYVADNPADFYSQNISGAHRLPNGNTLICSGAPGIFYEVTPEMNLVWHFEYGSPVFRISGFSVDFSGVTALDLHPPVQIEKIDKRRA